MKNHIILGILITVLLVSFTLLCGCTSQEAAPSTPTPTPTPKPDNVRITDLITEGIKTTGFVVNDGPNTVSAVVKLNGYDDNGVRDQHKEVSVGDLLPGDRVPFSIWNSYSNVSVWVEFTKVETSAIY